MYDIDDNPDYNMEMPCPCTHCRGWFELNDGWESEKWYTNTVICKNCFLEEEKEIERDEEIRDLKDQISDAEHTIKDAKNRLNELGYKN